MKADGSSWCRHYNGIGNHAACRAGVAYDSVRTPCEHTYDFGPSYGRPLVGKFVHPCFKDENPHAKACEHCSFLTEAEIAERDAEFDAAVRKVNAVRAAIVEKTGGQRGVRGRIACPACNGGTVGYSVAYNGHIAAKCNTDGCASWIE